MATNKVIYGDETIMDITDTTAEADAVAVGEVFYNRSGVRTVGTLAEATDETLGLVKTNSAKSITLNENSQLEVGGRLGQFSSAELPDGGLYYPLTIEPESVAKNSLLISEATNLTVKSSRTFALFAGAGVTLKKTAAAGATIYEVSNTFANRFTCACARGGYATIEEATAGTNIVKVKSVYLANDPSTPLEPYSGPNESGNNIIIETETSVNPSAETKKLRLYGSMTFDSSVHIGQGIGTGGITGQGKALQLGQSQLTLQGNSILVGNGIFNKLNRSALFGAQHINHQQSAFMAGELHNSVNGKKGVAALGVASIINSNSALVIGNGTSDTARSNILEITDDSGQTGIIMKSPNGTSYKLTVDDSGNLTTTQI